MKARNVILTLAILTTPMVLYSCAAVGIEKAEYTVLEKEGEFEIRQYVPRLEAVTRVDADFQDAGNIAFRRLFDYISGNNRTAESIAMTAPVNQQPASQKIAMTAPVNQQSVGDQYAVSFVMPSKYTLDTLPQPVDKSVVIKQIPAYRAAAIRYSGTWSQKRYETKKTALQEFMQEKQLTPNGPPIFARYNSPFQLWFLRHNEVIIPIE